MRFSSNGHLRSGGMPNTRVVCYTIFLVLCHLNYGQGGSVKKGKGGGGYDPVVELAKGAKLDAAAYDKTLKVAVLAGKVTVGGTPGIAEFSGIATGPMGEAGLEGTADLWLSIFRYMRPDGTTDHVGGWNIPLTLKAGQTPIEIAKAFAVYINAGTRPYKAKAAGNKAKATITIVFTPK